MPKVKARADTVSGNARAGVEKLAARHGRLHGHPGHARFEAPNTVRVGEELLTAPRIFINVGGRAVVPDMPGVRDVPFLTNTLDPGAGPACPRHLVVVGGSYVGLEFAQMYRRFGAEVTVVEKAPRLIAREDEDVSEAIRSILEGEGITVRTGAECISLAPHEHGVAVSVDCAEGPPEAIGSHVLLAVGRRPNTDDLGARPGRRRHRRARLHHGRREPGDQRARASGRSATATAAAPSPTPPTTTSRSSRPTCSTASTGESSERIPAYALYIDPPLGRVGMTEAQARATRPAAADGQAPDDAASAAPSRRARRRAS